jgi:hypothetical protein
MGWLSKGLGPGTCAGANRPSTHQQAFQRPKRFSSHTGAYTRSSWAPGWPSSSSSPCLDILAKLPPLPLARNGRRSLSQ